jgi:release factor glutamine methyltransferase
VSVDAALRLAAARLAHSDTPLLDARVLMKFATGLDDAGLIVRANDPLSADERNKFDEAVARRAKSEPVAYIAGVKEFWGLEFQVSPAALIPRPDSECLVEAALSRRPGGAAPRILDLGVGTGCLLCALLTELPDSFAIGVDRSPGAAALARENARRLGLASRAAFFVGDWGTALKGPFDIIVANPPYVPEADKPGLAPDIGEFEPAEALYAGADGLDAFRSILADAARYSARDGAAVFECGSEQTGAVAEMAAKAFPRRDIAILRDLAGRRRGVAASMKR